MGLDERIRARLERTLGVVDDHGTLGPRLLDDARRLWRRIEALRTAQAMTLAPPGDDALELANYALQLPLRREHIGSMTSPGPAGRVARYTLRDRAEEAAELLVLELSPDADPVLLDHSVRILRDLPERSPVMEGARLLADAINLDDFGVIGILQHMAQLTRHGEGLTQLASRLQTREQYGYWEARLRDGFHSETARALARARLEHARTVAGMINREVAERAPTDRSQ